MSVELSLIIPCYNEDMVIEETNRRINYVLDEAGINEYEIIYVNDGSSDKTRAILENLAEKDKKIRVINFSRNFGHQPAVTAGIHNCRGEYAIIIDADLQDPPELIPKLIAKYHQEDCDIVYCVRKSRKGESVFKKVTASCFYRLINKYSDVKFPLDTGDFRLINRKVIDEFKKLREQNKYIRGLISWLGFKQVPFYYIREERFAGETKYPLKKMINFALTGLTYFTKKPLEGAIKLGFFCILIGILLTVYTFLVKCTALTTAIPGWALIIIIVIFFGGIQLFTLGIIGVYIGNIFDEVKQRPEYIIDSIINP